MELWMQLEKERQLEPQLVEVEEPVQDYNEKRIEELKEQLNCASLTPNDIAELICLFTPPRA